MRIDAGLITAIIIEWIIFIYYSNTLFYRKKSKLFFGVLSAALYFVHFWVCTFGNVIINITTYVLINYLLFIICFHIKNRTALYQSVLLSTLSGLLEFLTVAIAGLGMFEKNSFTIMKDESAILTIYGKSLYFVSAVILAKFFKKKKDYLTSESLLHIGVLILTQLVTFFSIIISGEYYIKIILCATCIIIDIMVAVINQRSDARQAENEYLQNQIKKNEKNFSEMASLKYLHHDMDEHLSVLYHLLGEDNEQAKKYIEQLNSKKQQLTGFVDYTDNDMINIVLSEKMKECRDQGISFLLDPVTASLRLFNDMDAVTIFSNLLNNAIESCKNSADKKIYMRIYTVNENFVVIKTENSSDQKPLVIEGKLKTHKENEQLHGIGIHSIRNTLNQYNGKFTWSYDDDEKIFCCMIVIQCGNYLKSKSEKK